MDFSKSRNVSQQAYIDKVLRAKYKSSHAAAVGHLLKEGSGMGGDIVRHCILLTAVIGLVAIAAGATTESDVYWRMLNWVTSIFV